MSEQWDSIIQIAISLVAQYGPKIAFLLVIALVGWLLARWVGRAVRKFGENSKHLDQTLVPILSKLSRWSVILITIVVVLDKFGIDTTSLLAFLGAAGLAVGLALKDSVGDVASGVLLMVLRPFNLGDAVNIGGAGGVVQSIDIFETKITTFEGVPTVIPNSKVRSSNIENYTRAEKRRFEFMVGISYEDDIAKALMAIREVIEAETRVLSDPEHLINVMELGDNSVNILVRAWAMPGDFFAAKLDLTRAVKERLDKEGISIPFPQRDVHIIQGEA